jgi:16S rRNA (guanine527-N7)-methyltransferase
VLTVAAAVPAAVPAAAAECFGSALPLAVRYRGWLATAGVERGLLGPREVDRLWERHLLNSAALRDWLPETGVVLDLGSGAGLPGVVVALLRPDLTVVLLEPLLRRASFLSEVVADLALPSTTVVRARAEDYARTHPESVDTVLARAVAPLDRLVGWAAPLIRPGGFLLALKGETVSGELASAADAAAAWGMGPGEVLPVAVGDSVTRVVRLQRKRSVVPGRAAANRAGRRSQ